MDLPYVCIVGVFYFKYSVQVRENTNPKNSNYGHFLRSVVRPLFIDEYLYRIKTLQQYIHHKYCCYHCVSCLKNSRFKNM